MKTAAELLDHRNIMIAVKKGLVRREEFREALWEQRRLHAQTKAYKPIGDILIDRGILTESQRENILPPLLCRSMGWSRNPDQAAGNPSSTLAVDPGAEADGGKHAEPVKECVHNTPLRTPAKLSLRIDENGLAAFITPAREDYRDVSLQDVKSLLEREGIAFGRVDDGSILRHLEQQPPDISPFQVAAGLPPEPARPDEVNYYFDTNPFRVGTIAENGIMDWKDRGELPQVAQGDLLAEIIPGHKGQPGRNVFGQILEVPQSQRIRLRPGKGVEASEDHLKFFARVKGQPQITGQGTLSVLQSILIAGDVGIETGHVIFDGHIEVQGAVQRGYHVKGGSLKAREILSQNVEIAGDVVALRGIFGAKIRSGGRVKANHINKASIIAADDVVAAKEIVDCEIITNGKCILDGGTILSSEVCAKMGIRAGTVGSPASPPSTLVVGVDQIVQLQVAEYKQQIFDYQKAVTDLNRQIQELHLTSDRLNTQLGEIAQVQDRHMVEKRRIAEAVEAQGRMATETELRAMEQLQAEVTSIDGQVAQLMAEDEASQASIVALRTDIVTQEHNIQELKLKIEEAIAQSKQQAGIACLQVTGKLFARTHIKGPNDAIVVEELIEHVNIKEQKNTDPGLGKTHVLKVAGR